MRIDDFAPGAAICSLLYPEHLTLWAFRAIAARHGCCPAVAREFEDALGDHAGPTRKALTMFAFELGMATSAQHLKLKLAPPGTWRITRDEAALLGLISAAQRGDQSEVANRLALFGVRAPNEVLLAGLNVYAAITLRHGLALPGEEASVSGESEQTRAPAPPEARRVLH